jgi:hypothetical protein
MIPQEDCNSTEGRTTKEGVVLFVVRGKNKRKEHLIGVHAVRWICTLRPASRSFAQKELHKTKFVKLKQSECPLV